MSHAYLRTIEPSVSIPLVSLLSEELIAGDSMTTISVKEIERNRSKTAGRDRVSVPSANGLRVDEEDCCFAMGGSA